MPIPQSNAAALALLISVLRGYCTLQSVVPSQTVRALCTCQLEHTIVFGCVVVPVIQGLGIKLIRSRTSTAACTHRQHDGFLDLYFFDADGQHCPCPAPTTIASLSACTQPCARYACLPFSSAHRQPLRHAILSLLQRCCSATAPTMTCAADHAQVLGAYTAPAFQVTLRPATCPIDVVSACRTFQESVWLCPRNR